jgi:dihydroxy-acid dehydratase
MSDQPKRPPGLAGGLTHYGDPAFSLYLRRSFAKSMGYSEAMLSRPVVGIAYPPSGFNNCHRHFPELLEAVKRGVLAGGALPLEFPTISLGEAYLTPTSLKFRNLMAMDTEEMIRAQPMDAVVLMGGCDKTVPAQLMGALSADKPAVQLVAGPMMTGSYGGERLGACTDCRRFWAKFRAGQIDETEIGRIEDNLATTAGTCAVMGTASTMACIAEALGMALPGSAAIPAVHADRLRCAEATGLVAAGLAGSDRRPSRIVTEAAVENAVRVLLAIGGSTNAVIHLAAIAGRRGLKLSLERLNALSDSTPVLVNLKPVRQPLHGGFPCRRRARRRAARTRPAAPSRLPDDHRRDARRAAGAAARAPGRPRHRAPGRKPDRAGRRAGRAVRQPRPRWRHPEALGGRSGAVRARPPARSCSAISPTSPPISTTPRST